MKKTILIIVLIISTYIIVGNKFSKKIMIPDEAIRIRVIANSNSSYDQNIKYKVKDLLQSDIRKLISEKDSIITFRNKIIDNLDNFDNDINDLLNKNDYNLPVDINYGLNYFPRKEYKGTIYNEGYYESLVVTLGSGLGDNWWCVLFPPLCMIEASESSNIEYTTLVSELINKYF